MSYYKTITKISLIFLLSLPNSFSYGITSNIETNKSEENTGIILQSMAHAKAHWINFDTIVFPAENLGSFSSNNYYIFHSSNAGLKMKNGVLSGGDPIRLIYSGFVEENNLLFKNFPYFKDYIVLKIPKTNKPIQELLKEQLVFVAKDKKENIIDVTYLQNSKLLDDLFYYSGKDLGLTFNTSNSLTNKDPEFRLWAPTAKNVKLHIFENSSSSISLNTIPMKKEEKGIWFFRGNNDLINKFYLYEVEVFVPTLGKFVKNYVTDPYSVSLSTNSTKSHIVDLDSQSLKPDNWNNFSKPALYGFEDIVIYELHQRDFSINDLTVNKSYRGKFLAFTEKNSNGMKHLKSLSNSGLTHIHLLPVFDIATIEENEFLRKEPIIPSNLPPDSSKQQEIIGKFKDTDGFNWGYDPYHYGVPEGSYSTNPDGSKRIIEFREMVKSLSDIGLRLIIDVVYNHTHSALQDKYSVLDKITPGYYYRLDENGQIQNTSCCPDTASENLMMEKLMIDTLIRWAKHYKVDGFRFDLMGHHTTDNMRKIRSALDSLTLEKDGVDGKKIYLYGEGWKFGSLNNILPNKAFHQQNSYGYGIGTFNDRIRDSARGGNFQHNSKSDQGFINGLYYDYNWSTDNSETPTNLEIQKSMLLNYTDNIRLGLAGNLKNYKFINNEGHTVQGSQVKYRGTSGSGYAEKPYETINYISAHDNYTLWDQITAKSPYHTPERNPETATPYEKARMQNLGMSLITLGQGIPFIHAGCDMLRSKSGDGDSYNSGDWFNKLDFTYETNNWGVGLPIAEKNYNEWPFWKSRLEDESLKPSKDTILFSVGHFQRLLKIRKSSKLFRLPNENEIIPRIRFLNSERGKNQIPGLIVMYISDKIEGYKNIDPKVASIVVVFNALNKNITFQHDLFKNIDFKLHPVLNEEIKIDNIIIPPDKLMNEISFDKKSGTLNIPPKTTAVFFEND